MNTMNKTDRILAVVLAVSAILYALLLLSFDLVDLYRLQEEGHISYGTLYILSTLRGQLVLWLLPVPAFSLQLLLCRRVKRKWLAAVPSYLVVLAAAGFAVGFFTASGWDSFAYALLLIMCIPPAAGCLIAWAAYGGHRIYLRLKDRHPEEEKA